MATGAPPGPPPIPPKMPTMPPPPTPPPVDENVVQLGQLMSVLGQDPKYRDRILGLIEEAAPHVHIPERAVAREAEAKVAAATTPLREENKLLHDRLNKLEQGLSQREWQEQNGVDDEEMAAVTTFAREKKIGSPDAALDYFRKAELGRPRGSTSSAHLSEESRKELYKNPKAWYEKEATKILSESRRRRSA